MTVKLVASLPRDTATPVLPVRVTAITRLRLDAPLYEPAPPRPPETIGCPRAKGTRLPTLAATLAAKDTLRPAVLVPGWDGARGRTVEIASDTAVWRHGGMPVVPIRWVVIRDPEARFPVQPLLCTDLLEPLSLRTLSRRVRSHVGARALQDRSIRKIQHVIPDRDARERVQDRPEIPGSNRLRMLRPATCPAINSAADPSAGR